MPLSDLPRQASPLRRLLHVALAAVGWVVFVYWWWLVFGRVSRREVVFTLIFIAATTVLTVVVTSIWSLHNKRLHRRLGPRVGQRPVDEEYPHDTMYRPVMLEGGRECLVEESWVQLQVSEQGKLYRRGGVAVPDGAVAGRSGAHA